MIKEPNWDFIQIYLHLHLNLNNLFWTYLFFIFLIFENLAQCLSQHPTENNEVLKSYIFQNTGSDHVNYRHNYP